MRGLLGAVSALLGTGRARGGMRPRATDSRGAAQEPEAATRTVARPPRDLVIEYRPDADGTADAGEIVWTWVPYEEDHSKGKDRPVLLIARDGQWLLGLQVTSQDHDRDADQEARAGRYWIDIGSGAWDNQGRPSEARVNRLIRIEPDAVRRVGAILDERTFDDVAREVLRHY